MSSPGNILTIATNPRVVPVDFGVLHMSGNGNGNGNGSGEMQRVRATRRSPTSSTR